MSSDESYGISRGVEISECEIVQMVEEAEAGYDVEALRRRGSVKVIDCRFDCA